MRTLDDIVPPSRRASVPSLDTSTPPSSGGHQPLRTGSSRRGKFPFTTLIVGFAVVLGTIGVLVYFSGARVEITPNTTTAAIQGSFTATPESGDLPYLLISAEKVASQAVSATGSKTVSESASGTITIYNTQSKVQKLVTNTRFATASGLIFRTHSAVSVPAGTPDRPGSVSAKVYADQPGDSYNVGPSSFSLPGLAGTAQASQVYAKSIEAMTGGASGTIPVVEASLDKTTRDTLQAALVPELTAALQNQIPSGYILLSGSTATNFTPLQTAASATTGMADIKEQGTITAVVFPNAALASAIANTVSGLSYRGEPVTLASTNGLTLNADVLPTAEQTSFTFSLTGNATLSYTVDPNRIAAVVAGKNRKEAEVALTNYQEVKRAVLILRPFWKTSFPEDPSAITVSVSPVVGN